MDIDLLRSLFTVLALVTFVVIVAWAWSGSNRERFEGAARLPLLEDDPSARRQRAAGKTNHE